MKKLIFLLLLAGVCFASWTTPVDITRIYDSSQGEYIQGQSMYIFNDTYHFVWSLVLPDANNSIFYTKSLDRGLTWDEERVIFEGPNEFSHNNPYIVIDSNGVIYVAWNSFFNSHEIVMKKSTDGGASWSGLVNITNSGSYDELNPYLAVDFSDNIYLLFENYVTGFPEIFFSKSTDGGVTWSSFQNISLSPSTTSTDIFVTAAFSDDVHAVWRENNLLRYCNSLDGGSSWSAPITIGSAPDTIYSAKAAVNSNGDIYIPWESFNPDVSDNIYFSKSTDDGVNWSLPEVMVDSEGTDYYNFYPYLIFDSNDHLHLFWSKMDGVDPYYTDIMYINSSDNGTVWSSPLTIVEHNVPAGIYEVDLLDFFIDDSDEMYILFKNYFSGGNASLGFTKSFLPPVINNFSLFDAGGNAFDFNSTSLKINNSAVNVTWSGLNASQVYPLSGRNLSSTVAIASDASSASITVSEATLNASANITITGLSGVTSPVITHGGVVVYENGALTAENGADYLLSDPVFADGTLTMEVGSFSEWTVEEASVSADNLTISAPEFDYLLILILFSISAMILVKK